MSLDNLSELSVDAFYGVGCVDHLWIPAGKTKKPYDPIPGSAPSSNPGRALLASSPRFESVQRVFGCICIERLVNGLECLGQCSTLIPSRII